jgi:hypothetical protein
MLETLCEKIGVKLRWNAYKLIFVNTEMLGDLCVKGLE